MSTFAFVFTLITFTLGGVSIGIILSHFLYNYLDDVKRRQYNAKRRLKYAQRKAKKILETVVQ